MKKTCFASSRVSIVSFYTVFLLCMLVITSACAGGKNHGALVLDRELDNIFSSFQVLPDHQYYVTGGYAAPAAILAIHKDYLLDNKANLWVPVPGVDSAQMEIWIDNLDKYVKFWSGPEFMAAYILGPDKNKVGAWYSGQRYTRLEFFEDNRIKVYPPDLKTSIGGEHERREKIKP